MATVPGSATTQVAGTAIPTTNLNIYKAMLDWLSGNVAGPRPYCFSYLAGSCTLSTGAVTIVNLDTDVTDTDGMHTGSNGFFTVNTAGLYHVVAQLDLPTTTTGHDSVAINHTATGGGTSTPIAADDTPFLTGNHRMNVSCYQQCAVGDLITLIGFSNSTTVTVNPSTGAAPNLQFNTFMQALWVSE